MFTELAAGLILAPLAATPPHLTAPVWLMRPTAPVEVLFFTVFLLTYLACLHTAIKLTLSTNKLRKTCFHFFSFTGHCPIYFLEKHQFVNQFVHFKVHFLDFILKTCLFVFVCTIESQLLFGKCHSFVKHFLSVLSEVVSFTQSARNYCSKCRYFRNVRLLCGL
jgi:hypothetical protein